ncbi:ATP-dependent DNA helicase Rep [Scenedesmus sp. NREL 46B-D3]|nr:ATP-dependent DNA helicase Rep [Scenedesmus sp. NREL 46B-D3]
MTRCGLSWVTTLRRTHAVVLTSANTPRPCLHIAGPSSGKTRVVAARVAHLIASGAAPESLLVITFTRRAAGELKERLKQLLGPVVAGRVRPCTCHSLCLNLLRHQQHENFCAGVNGLERLASPTLQTLRINTTIAADQLMDFDDLHNARALLQENPMVQKKVHGRWRHILVDESQDTNLCQFELVQQLTSPGSSLFMVGDPDQAIYGFRGAKPRLLSTVKAHRTDVHVCN